MILNIVIILLIVLGSYLLLFKKNNEGFGYTYTYPIPSITKFTEVKVPEMWDHPNVARHARLNSFNGVEYVDDKPPCARGEYGCRPVNCPAVFEDRVICWKCEDIIAQPEYDGPKEIYGGRHY